MCRCSFANTASDVLTHLFTSRLPGSMSSFGVHTHLFTGRLPGSMSSFGVHTHLFTGRLPGSMSSFGVHTDEEWVGLQPECAAVMMLSINPPIPIAQHHRWGMGCLFYDFMHWFMFSFSSFCVVCNIISNWTVLNQHPQGHHPFILRLHNLPVVCNILNWTVLEQHL